jgi:hypothetical protein
MVQDINETPTTRSVLLEKIEAFLCATSDYGQALPNKREWLERNFGWKVIGDVKLIDRLRTGGDITTRKLDKILKHIITNMKG